MAEDQEGQETQETTTPEWASSIENEGLRSAVSSFESQEQLLDAIGYKAPEPEPTDWRDGLTDDLRKTADRFASPEDAIRSIQAFQKREGQIRVPGKDASDDERAAYLKAIGVPEKADGYEFPEIPADELTDEVKASRQQWAETFHKLNVPAETAKQLSEALNAEIVAQLQSQAEADKQFAKNQEESLRFEWKKDYEKNVAFANRAFEEIANRSGLDLDALRKIETSDGRFLFDRAEVLKMFATVGREMSEGSLGPAMSESEREGVEGEVRALRKQIAEAQADGDSKRAGELYQKELRLLEKMTGNQTIVGAAGRVA